MAMSRVLDLSRSIYCCLTALLVLLFSDPVRASAPEEIVIGMGGDVSLSRTGVTELNPLGATFERFMTWEEMTRGLVPWTHENDFNFINLESVVTAQPKLVTDQKYSQRSYPSGVEYLLSRLNINLVSTANNHATDFGQQGLNDTFFHLSELQKKNIPFVQSGVGVLPDVYRPQIIEYRGLRIAFSAIGMKGDGREERGRPTSSSVGMLSVRRCGDGTNEVADQTCSGGYSDYEKVLSELKSANADFKILSLHEGTELAVHVQPGLSTDDSRQRRDNRNVIQKINMAEAAGVDLVIGHHSHNVRPIRLQNKKLSFFGLGNLLFLGGRNYDYGVPDWNRYGLWAKTYYTVQRQPTGAHRFVLSAIEVIPLKSVHAQPQAWGSIEGTRFIRLLNEISRKNFKEAGVNFKATKNGTGIYCVPQIDFGARASQLCRQ